MAGDPATLRDALGALRPATSAALAFKRGPEVLRAFELQPETVF